MVGASLRRGVGGVVAGALLAAMLSTAVADDRRVVTSLQEMRSARVVLQEWDLSCGAAAVTTILNYQHGDRISERDVALALINQERYLEVPELVRVRHGFSLLDIKRFVEARGYRGVGYGRLTLDDLVRLAPVMTPIRNRGYNHFVVFRGRMGNRVLMADPAFGTRTMTVEKFERVWLDYGALGKVGFIIARPGADGSSPPAKLAPRPYEFVSLR